MRASLAITMKKSPGNGSRRASGLFKPADLTASSTLDWAAWWREQSKRDHTDWQHLITGADLVMQQLRMAHGVSS